MWCPDSARGSARAASTRNCSSSWPWAAARLRSVQATLRQQAFVTATAATYPVHRLCCQEGCSSDWRRPQGSISPTPANMARHRVVACVAPAPHHTPGQPNHAGSAKHSNPIVPAERRHAAPGPRPVPGLAQPARLLHAAARKQPQTLAQRTPSSARRCSPPRCWWRWARAPRGSARSPPAWR